MSTSEPQLSQFNRTAYRPGRSRWIQALWFFVGAPLLRSGLIPSSGLRAALLKVFGADVGHGLVIKPGVKVKYPWRLTLGNFCWLGEDCWIDNIADVAIGDNACVSQGAYLCTGNHDWSDVLFKLTAAPITVNNGAWIGAKAVIGPGVCVHTCGIVTAGSVAVRSVPSYEIHSGNPAQFLRKRVFHNQNTESPDVSELVSSGR